jgi:hypothetical protein
VTFTNDICFQLVHVFHVSVVFVIVRKCVNMEPLVYNILGVNIASVSDIGLDRRGIPG